MCAGVKYFATLALLWCQFQSVQPWEPASDYGQASVEWKSQWCLNDLTCQGPNKRYGHTMVLDGSRAILFGGRSTDAVQKHQPTTYEVQDINGSIEVTSYDKLVYDCEYFLRRAQFVDPNATIDSINCTQLVEEHQLIGTTVLLNDVWMFDLNCTLTSSCLSQEWVLMDPGSLNGGCQNFLASGEICTHPSERYFHGAAVFNDSSMLIYGGYSHACEDYCDDLWSFDLRDSTWTELQPLDQPSPGKRWKFSTVQTSNVMVLFGGMRLWHGFSELNSESNGWGDTSEYESGGFMDDMWIFEKRLLQPSNDPEHYGHDWEQTSTDSSDIGAWSKLEPPEVRKLEVDLKTIQDSVQGQLGDVGEQLTDWPSARAGHTAALDNGIGGMWLYGGFRAHYPYISTKGAGSAEGVTAASRVSRLPFGGFQYFLDDLWLFNFSGTQQQAGLDAVLTGNWVRIRPLSTDSPLSRTEQVLVVSGRTLIMHGGFHRNQHLNDTWLFDIPSRRWLLKDTFTRPLYPSNCTDDLEYIEDPSNDCFALQWPKELERSSASPFNVLSASKQTFYTPVNESDGTLIRYYGIIDQGERITLGSVAPDGTPIVPFAKSGPNQFVRNVSEEATYFLGYNETHNVTVYERCTSVRAEPTRGTTLDGLHGRAEQSVLIPQPRRQRPGWDGCRDRHDNRSDLPLSLQWDQPLQRSAHAAVYSEEYDVMFILGGRGPDREEPYTVRDTHDSVILSDVWLFDINSCPNNCSSHGNCSYGYCRCEDGYYGLDCSNISCPGDYCYYDEHTHMQVCKHCCSAGYAHSDSERYIERVDVHKEACSASNAGESHGICDGFGTCQCTPPYLGDDCSIKDCPDNCNYNGWCSVEYPVSRCVCNPTYFGEACQYVECLNNCSYPNGECDFATGECDCRHLYSPYNNTRVYRIGWDIDAFWEGEDCSWLTAYAAAPSHAPMLTVLVMAFSLVLAGTWAFAELEE